MTLQQIESFIAVVENGSLAKAAEKSFVTQPALTHRINELEKELGVTLILRQRGVRKSELTDAGKAFFPKAIKWRDLWNETIDDIQNVKKENIRFAIGPGFMDHFGRELCLCFAESGFEMNASFTIGGATEIYRRIENGEADWGLVIETCQSKYADTILVAEEGMVLLSSEAVEGKSVGDTVSFLEMDSNKEIEYTWANEYINWRNHWRKESDIAPIYTDSLALLEYFFKERGGWGIVPKSFADKMQEDKNFYAYNVKENAPIIKIYLVSAKEPKQPYFDCFKADLVSMLSNLGGVRICI